MAKCIWKIPKDSQKENLPQIERVQKVNLLAKMLVILTPEQENFQ